MRNLSVSGFVLLVVASYSSEACEPSGQIIGKAPPRGQCSTESDAECCRAGQRYSTYDCSPPVSAATKAVLYLNSFEEGGDGGAPSACDNRYHSDDTLVVALSTGWYNGRSRCPLDWVVDACDSTAGCDEEQGYQPPCPNNVMNGSKAVWKALGVAEASWGELNITWSDASRPFCTCVYPSK